MLHIHESCSGRSRNRDTSIQIYPQYQIFQKCSPIWKKKGLGIILIALWKYQIHTQAHLYIYVHKHIHIYECVDIHIYVYGIYMHIYIYTKAEFQNIKFPESSYITELQAGAMLIATTLWSFYVHEACRCLFINTI